MEGKPAEIWLSKTREAWSKLERLNLVRSSNGNLTLSAGNFIRAFGAVPTQWDDAADAALASRLRLRHPGERWSDDNVAKAKAIRIGYATAFPGLGRVRPSEEAFAEAMRDWIGSVTVDAGPTLPKPERVGDVASVPFAFAYDPDPPERTTRRLVLGQGTVHVTTVTASDAPVAYALDRLDGTKVEVRDVEGTLFRPVMRAGEATGASLADFAKACAGRDPWRDSPFLRRGATAFRPRGDDYYVHDGAVASTTELAYQTNGAKREVAERAAEDMTVSVGRLILVDGVVHRETPAPTLHVVVRCANPEGDAPTTVGLAWKLGNLDSDTPQGSLPDNSSRTLWPIRLRFPHDMAPLAADVARRVAEGLGVGFASTASALLPVAATSATSRVQATRDAIPATDRPRPWDPRLLVSDVDALSRWATTKAAEPHGSVNGLKEMAFHAFDEACEEAARGTYDREDEPSDEAVLAF